MLHTVRGHEITAAQLYPLLRLRVDVFVVEQDCPYPELDGRDLSAETMHLWCQGDDGPIGYLRVLRDGDGFRIGRVCTAKAARGTGVGARLMTSALATCSDAELVLDAQTYARDFYARFGFVAEGEPFLEDGIEHITMRRPRRTG
ncbi:GNAT family N-acetyltransferase [Microlunatus soli]|uniref:GNAT family N-acetyltransferase n=1 Tax=Microlunatus soli TaxID=630515 RepID=UPI001E5847A7|nr:GNAT family N-acetyltransferase [Microlunatus soli]